MTPAQHIAHAESELQAARDLGNDWELLERVTVALTAIGHGLIAIAIELGAPHQSGDTAAASSG